MSNKLTRTIGKVKLATIKHSPEILLVAGIASGVATIVFACKGTLKAGDVIVSLDGKAITGISSLVEAVNKYSPGDIVSVTVLRSEQLLTFGIILTR